MRDVPMGAWTRIRVAHGKQRASSAFFRWLGTDAVSRVFHSWRTARFQCKFEVRHCNQYFERQALINR